MPSAFVVAGLLLALTGAGVGAGACARLCAGGGAAVVPGAFVAAGLLLTLVGAGTCARFWGGAADAEGASPAPDI